MPHEPHRFGPTDTVSEFTRLQRRSFALIAAIVVLLLMVSIAASWVATSLVNSTRAYATAEGRYSKAEKMAVLDLHRYAYSLLDSDFIAFQKAIDVPRGDHVARLALETNPSDLTMARDGFRRGQNHADDIEGMILLFKLAQRWTPFAAAVEDWRLGDVLVASLLASATQINRRIASGSLDSATRDRLLAEIDDAEDQLTALEYTFATHIGEAARTATIFIVYGVGSVTLLLWMIGMVFARQLMRRQVAIAEREAAALAYANEQLRASALNLEAAGKVAEREKVRAEKASKAKSDFLSNMSHELRTPLNSVLGFAQLLEFDAKDPLPDRQKRQVIQIRKSGDLLLSLIDDVLDLSKIESGNINLSVEPVQLKPLLEQVQAALSPQADKAGILLTMTIADDIPLALADRTRLLQVLMNLGNNALKYNRAGGSLSLSAEPGDVGRVRLVVQDTGQGIAIDRQQEVFQAFNRLGAEQSAVEGTGIGLNISQRLVHLMGGLITFDSMPGVGTTFRVEIPGWKGDSAAARERPSSNIIDLQKLKQGSTLLYVEDNPSNIELMQGLVEALDGVSLLTATHPTAGLALAEAHLPNVIVLDIDLPEMSGFQVLARLKATLSTSAIPVIALSAAAMPRDIERGLAAGFTHYLTKPIDVRAFLAAVDTVLREPARDRRLT